MMTAIIAASKRRYRAAVLGDGALALWRFNNNTNDDLGTYNGTAVGSPSYVDGATQDGNKAIALNGSSQYVKAANGSSLAFADTTFSIELFFKASTTAVNQFIVTKDFAPTGNGWAVELRSTGALAAETKGASGSISASRFTTATAFGDNTWHYVMAIFRTSTTVVANNDILAIIVDGVPQTLGANTGTVAYVAPTLEVEIGRRSSGGYFAGLVDEVSIYSGDMSDRALAHYNAR